MTTSDTERALAAATGAQRAAHAVAVDPACEPRHAAHHLVVAWEALARATSPEGHVPQDLADLPRWLPQPLQAAIGPAQVAGLARELPALLAERGRPAWDGQAFALGRGEVEAHSRRLGQLLARARARAPGRREAKIRAGARALALAAVALGVAVVLVRPWQTLVTPPWRGTYFTRNDLTGASVVRHDHDVAFEWGRGAPMDEIPADRFSVRWDTCIRIDAPVKLVFQSISDDGSRVYVDGKLVVLNRTKKQVQSRGGAARLTPGEHHIRVEYSELTGDANIQVLASFAGEPPAPIPADRLRPPGDGEQPCQ